MKVEVKKVYNVEKCSQCPYMSEYIYKSVLFDESNFERYCDHPDLSRLSMFALNESHTGKLIETGTDESQKCDIIPEWCPEKKKQEQEIPCPMTFGSAWDLDSLITFTL